MLQNGRAAFEREPSSGAVWPGSCHLCAISHTYIQWIGHFQVLSQVVDTKTCAKSACTAALQVRQPREAENVSDTFCRRVEKQEMRYPLLATTRICLSQDPLYLPVGIPQNSIDVGQQLATRHFAETCLFLRSSSTLHPIPTDLQPEALALTD